MASEVKSQFSINGVKYTDIKSRIEARTNEIKIGVSGTAQMIRQWIKQKYPNIPSSDYAWVKSRKFANGNAIDIYLNYAPDEIYNDIRSELESSFEYGSYHYGTQQKTTKIAANTDGGNKIDYGTKYLSVENKPPNGVDASTVDWDNLTQPSKKVGKSFVTKSSSGSGKTFDRGELISDCAGWEVNKKLYANGKILYSANKKPNTPKNKTDWSLIKGEVLTETGFSYSKYGNFQKFGQIASESVVIAKLCEILGKYYVNNASTQTNTPTNPLTQVPKISKIADILINTNNNLISKLPTKNAFKDQLLYSLNWTNVLLNIPITEENNLLKGTYWKESLREDIKNLTDKELIAVGVIIKERNENIVNNVLGLCGIYGQKGIDLYKERYEKDAISYLYPLWFETLLKNRTPQIPTPTSPTGSVIDPKQEAEAREISRAFSRGFDRIWLDLNINSGSDLYNSETLQKETAQRFAKVYMIVINNYPNITEYQKKIISEDLDETNQSALGNALALSGFFGSNEASAYLGFYKSYPNQFLNPINYGYNLNLLPQPAVVPPPTVTTGLNLSYKTLPPNPKLEYCTIERAEGSYPDGTFPIQFQSFTALTKFIADNIEEMPKKGEGYDKYFISYKWKFEDKEDGDRYDVSEDGDNPYKHTNLWAYDTLRSLCFYAWQTKGMSPRNYSKDDEFYTNKIGKEGWEINSDQFQFLLSEIIKLYPEDKTKYDYNTKDERLDRFKEVYPKLFKLFLEQTAVVTKESVESIIKMYEIKAKRGDTAAESIIKMYKIQLKRL
jgi:hypothetical protein